MKVTILNRKNFEILLMSKYAGVNPVEGDMENCFISIHNYDQAVMEDDHHNFLNLWFDDITDDALYNKSYYPSCYLFTEKQARLIIEFCEYNQSKKNLFVHCFAGISRSGAVGTFINDIWGEESFQEFSARHPWLHHNPYVKMLLMREYRERGNT